MTSIGALDEYQERINAEEQARLDTFLENLPAERCICLQGTLQRVRQAIEESDLDQFRRARGDDRGDIGRGADPARRAGRAAGRGRFSRRRRRGTNPGVEGAPARGLGRQPRRMGRYRTLWLERLQVASAGIADECRSADRRISADRAAPRFRGPRVHSVLMATGLSVRSFRPYLLTRAEYERPSKPTSSSQTRSSSLSRESSTR